jgi:hypothetical protein
VEDRNGRQLGGDSASIERNEKGTRTEVEYHPKESDHLALVTFPRVGEHERAL